ncbi:MAG TPA: alpha/beta hydrolase [Terracidiphilus sp.]|jgi:pimeloyl-ACP methyl ester carboxylesterase
MARLLVFVPGIQTKADSFKPLLARLQADPAWRQDTVVELWDHGTSIFGRKSLLDIARNLALFLNARWANLENPDDVILVGHSMGALLVRQAYLIALGSSVNRMNPLPWATHVSRLVLLAGINRGIQIHWWEKLLLPLLISRHGTLRDIIVGSDFITNLRIWWLRKLQQISSRPVVVQVLGENDNRVQQGDSLDVERFDEGHQFLISKVTHKNVFLPEDNGAFRPQQYETLSLAILKPIPDQLSSEVSFDLAKKVYFLVHGIRDSNNDWVKETKQLIKQRIPNAELIEPDIGRFSALQFLIPAQRRHYVRWFQDVYSRKLAQNPLASFNFVGHSYGTYLLGYGLRHLSGMTFDRVYLGGSVLPAEWVWDNHRAQVQEVRNACGVHDVPVGVLCSALRGLRMKDIGTAGYTGFRLAFNDDSEVHYYRGGHGASVSSAARADILEFLCHGLQHKCGDLVVEDSGFTRISAGVRLASPLLIAAYLLLIIASFFYPPLHAARIWLLAALGAVLSLLVGVTAFV